MTAAIDVPDMILLFLFLSTHVMIFLKASYSAISYEVKHVMQLENITLK